MHRSLFYYPRLYWRVIIMNHNKYATSVYFKGFVCAVFCIQLVCLFDGSMKIIYVIRNALEKWIQIYCFVTVQSRTCVIFFQQILDHIFMGIQCYSITIIYSLQTSNMYHIKPWYRYKGLKMRHEKHGTYKWYIINGHINNCFRSKMISLHWVSKHIHNAFS